MKTKNKKFDSVKMMREIRNNLHQKYSKNPEKREEDLKRIREKYITSKSASQ